MGRQYITAAVIAMVVTVVPMAWAGQAPDPDGWTVPRTAAGRPDLQGIWANDSATPFQRRRFNRGRNAFPGPLVDKQQRNPTNIVLNCL